MGKDFKAIIISINIDNILKNITKAPKRCARNIIELGLATTFKDNLKLKKELSYNNLLTFIAQCKLKEIKEWFFDTFL